MSKVTGGSGTAVRKYGAFIGGQSVRPADADYLDVVNPANGDIVARVLNASAAHVDDAVRSARQAFEEGDWPTFKASQRATALMRLGMVVETHAEELAALQVAENGKLYREMLGQVKLLPEYFNYYAALAQMPTGHTNPLHVSDMVNYTVREPIGVVAAITPWNSPLLLLAWKLGPALAAGNTVVAKPSEVSPVSTIRFAELASEAGLPPGVFNVVTGLGHPAGTALVSHPEIDKIAFTGSTRTGQAIAQEAGKTLKRVSLELGGKSPNIVFEDADLASAINGLVAGIFGASGQTCMAGSRIMVQETIYDSVVAELAKRAEAITIGDPMNPKSEMGSIASPVQYEKVLEYVGVGVEDGARLVTGGTAHEVEGHAGGLFLRPAVFAEVDNGMRLAREEVFGPIAVVIKFKDEADAIRIANDTQYGLAAGIWTKDVQRAHRVAGRLRAGTVWINNYRKSSYATPFGGYKQSGLGRENGPDALREYTEEKSVWIDTGQGIKDPFNPRA